MHPLFLIQAQCSHYYCIHSETDAPGHFTKFCLKTLIEDINKGICPQVPWKNWNVRRLTPLTTPSPMSRSSSPNKLQYNLLSPVYQPKTPTMPALLLLPLSKLLLASPLPQDPLIVPSTLPITQHTHV
jgi:hypothetical protein